MDMPLYPVLRRIEDLLREQAGKTPITWEEIIHNPDARAIDDHADQTLESLG